MATTNLADISELIIKRFNYLDFLDDGFYASRIIASQPFANAVGDARERSDLRCRWLSRRDFADLRRRTANLTQDAITLMTLRRQGVGVFRSSS